MLKRQSRIPVSYTHLDVYKRQFLYLYHKTRLRIIKSTQILKFDCLISFCQQILQEQDVYKRQDFKPYWGIFMSIIDLINSLPGAVAQGLIWGIMAIGVYITYRTVSYTHLDVYKRQLLIIRAPYSDIVARSAYPCSVENLFRRY